MMIELKEISKHEAIKVIDKEYIHFKDEAGEWRYYTPAFWPSEKKKKRLYLNHRIRQYRRSTKKNLSFFVIENKRQEELWLMHKSSRLPWVEMGETMQNCAHKTVITMHLIGEEPASKL